MHQQREEGDAINVSLVLARTLASTPNLKVKQYPVQHFLSRGRAFTPSDNVKTKKEAEIFYII